MRGAPQIEQISIKKLRADPRNTRTHSADQVVKLMASLREFGFTQPVLIDENSQIIAGHGRVMAAKKLGLLNVPCIRIDYMTPEQKRAYVIADNKIAEESGWDTELLQQELTALAGKGFDVGLTGFSAKSFVDDMAAIDEEQKNDRSTAKPETDIHILSDDADFPEIGYFELPVIRTDMIFKVPDRLSIWCGSDMSGEFPAPYFYNFGSDSTRGLDLTKTVLGFYVDDYRFERFWDESSASVLELKKKNYLGVVTPNFSTYFNWSKAVRMYSTYRSRWVARYMQEAGIEIVPDISCAPADLEHVLDGLDGIKTVGIQAHQNYKDPETRMQKAAVVDFVMETLKPETVLLYAPKKV